MDSQPYIIKGECSMFGLGFGQICLVLFFLWYGLAAFVPALNTDMWKKVGAVLALLFAVLALVKM